MHVNGELERGRPEEPPPSTFTFPADAMPDERGKVLEGGDLDPGTLLAAYRTGHFPMRQNSGALAWWSPDPRGVLFVDRLCVSRSLRRSLRRFSVTVDACFDAVVDACARRAPGEYEWITAEVRSSYGALHRLGWAHSIETWTADREPPELVGGLYGVAVGGLFSGESMFHRQPDASKAALVRLIELLRDDGGGGAGRMVDVQWLTPHLASLGAIEIRRAEYLVRLNEAIALAAPPGFCMPAR